MSTTIPATIAYRLSYQDGMFLTADAMNTEQSYFVRTIALQNSMLYTPGYLLGLSVSQTNGNALAIEAGGGIDESGNFVIMPSGSGNALTVPTTAANPSLVYLVYPSNPTLAGQAKGMPPYTVNMAGVPTLAAVGAAPPANSIVLAQIGLNDQGQVVSITDKRVPVTCRVKTAADSPVTSLTATASAPVPQGNAAVQGTLTVPVEKLPTTVTVYFNEQKVPAFATTPHVQTQVLGSVAYPTAVTATTISFDLTIGAALVTPSQDAAVTPLQVSWRALA